MKSRTLPLIAAMAIFAVLDFPLPLVAQGDQDHRPKHHHYRIIDIGTFGGPSSYFDDLALSDRFGFLPFIFEIAPVLNKHGVLAGWADTSMPDPNPAFCFNPDCFVSHAFRWRNGVKTDLGVLPGGASSAALWINSRGLIVGMSQNGVIDPLTGIPEVRGVVWKKGQIADLGTFGGNVSYASAVNNQGQVVGTALNEIPDQFSFYDLLFTLPGSLNGTQTRAFLWDEEHGMQDLGTLGGFDATANLVNQRGQVAGFSYTNSTPNPTTGIPTFHPFLWDREKGMRDLGSLGGTALGSVNALNERGQVVGATTIAGDLQLHPFLWDGAKLIDLVAPPFGGSANGEAAWINEAGEVVGLAGIPASCPPGSLVTSIQHAFLWRKGVIMDLGTVAGTRNSEGDFINSKSQIVGLAWTCNFSFTAILWENDSMVDLNKLIPRRSRFHLKAAPFIDDRGQIAALGTLPNGDTHALLLIPCDEEHSDAEGCEDAAEGATASGPQNVAPSDTTVISRPNATLSPTSLTFPTQVIGTVSVPKTVTLKNTGTASLTISSIAITGNNARDFAQTHTCGSSLAAGASCSISVEFKPTASGTRSAALSITDNAPGSPQKVALTGTGVAPTCIPIGGACFGPARPHCCRAPFPHHSFCSNPTGWGTCIES